MSTMWILVCDSAKARFFEVRGDDAAWQLLAEVFHEGSRRKAAVIEGDRSGSRSPQGGSVHHNALAPASSPKDVEKQHFAHELAKTLDEAKRSSRFRDWVLVAPPHFVGLVVRELTPELEKSLLTKVDKDFNHLERARAEGQTRRRRSAKARPTGPHSKQRRVRAVTASARPPVLRTTADGQSRSARIARALRARPLRAHTRSRVAGGHGAEASAQ